MAEDTDTGSDSGGKKLSLKTLLILAAIFVIEGGVIAGIFLVAGKPADVQADGAAEDHAAMAEEGVEELVVAEKFPNTKRGRTYIYDAEIFIVVKRKYQPEVQGKLAGMAAQISGDVRTIISRAEPNHLLEPTLATLKRQIKVALDDRLGRDDEGQSRIERVVITKFTQFRADL